MIAVRFSEDMRRWLRGGHLPLCSSWQKSSCTDLVTRSTKRQTTTVRSWATWHEVVAHMRLPERRCCSHALKRRLFDRE